jgi:hypothetical protein
MQIKSLGLINCKKKLYFLQLSPNRNKFITMTRTSPTYMCFVLSKFGDELRKCNDFQYFLIPNLKEIEMKP